MSKPIAVLLHRDWTRLIGIIAKAKELEGGRRGGLRMYYDLNVPYTANHGELQRTLAFLAELGYNTIALDHTIAGRVAPEITNQIPSPLPFSGPSSVQILRRCTIHLSDPSQNHRLNNIASVYDIVALRPTTEKCLQQACLDFECDLISLDLSTRFPFYFRHSTFAVALQRGVKFEICYSLGILNSDGGSARRNLISNATQLIRATRGRGIVISSEANRALACRGPADVINMAILWGLGQEKGTEAISREARSAVVQAGMRRRSYRGVVDVVYGGEKSERPVPAGTITKTRQGKDKRKAEELQSHVEDIEARPVSKREQKRRAKKARLENEKAQALGTKDSLKDVPARQDVVPTIMVPNDEAG